MDMITVTNSFRHPGKRLALLIATIVCICGGCQKPAGDVSHSFGKQKDLTEDLYHRLKAGMFEPGKEPVVCQIMEIPSFGNNAITTSLKLKRSPHKIARISWERGTLRVHADDLGRVVIYMDEEALFSHVQVATLKGLGVGLQFFEVIEQPIRKQGSLQQNLKPFRRLAEDDFKTHLSYRILSLARRSRMFFPEPY